MISLICEFCNSPLHEISEKDNIGRNLYECTNKKCLTVFKLKRHSVVRDIQNINIVAHYTEKYDDRKNEAIICNTCNNIVDYYYIISTVHPEDDFHIRRILPHKCNNNI